MLYKKGSKVFACFKGPINIYNDIKNGQIILQKEHKLQGELRSVINEILKGNPNYKSKDQIRRIKDIQKLYNGLEKVLHFYNDYTIIVYKSKYKSIHGAGFKILTPKQMLQRLPIALAQVKAGNASQNVLNEIKLYIFCIKEKILLKKYTTIW